MAWQPPNKESKKTKDFSDLSEDMKNLISFMVLILSIISLYFAFTSKLILPKPNYDKDWLLIIFLGLFLCGSSLLFILYDIIPFKEESKFRNIPFTFILKIMVFLNIIVKITIIILFINWSSCIQFNPQKFLLLLLCYILSIITTVTTSFRI